MRIYYVIVEKIGRTVKGRNFVKGDYIPTVTEYFAKTAKGWINLPREQVLQMLAQKGLPNVKRITTRMLSLLRGMHI